MAYGNSFIKIILLIIFSLNPALGSPEATMGAYNAVEIQSDSKIIVAGSMDIQTISSFLAARYNTDGTVDSSFGDAGQTNTTIGEYSESFDAKIQSSDQFIVLVGYAFEDAVNKIALARYDTTGALDTSFGVSLTGTVTTQIGTGAQANSVALQSDGKIVVAGSAVIDGQSQVALLRYNSNGTLDTAGFGSNGIVTTPVGLTAYGRSVYIQPDGKIVVVGQSEQFLLVMRYTTAGALDTTFNSTGIVTKVINDFALANGVEIVSGNIFVGGKSKNEDNEYGIIVEYDSTGTIVPAFGNSGVVQTVFGIDTHGHDVKSTSTEDKIILVGHTDGNAFMAQYNISDGSIDTGFGIDGLAEIVTENESYFNSLAIDADDKLVGVGVNDFHEFAVRLSHTGSSIDEIFDLLAVNASTETIVSAYDTQASQSVSVGSWVDITYNSTKELEGWSHTAGTASFTCNVFGKYQITYILFCEKTTAGTAVVSYRLTLDGVEIAGSQGAVHLPSTTNLPIIATSSTIEAIASNQVLRVQASASNTGVQVAPNGIGDTPVSAVLVVQRVAD